MPDFKIEKLFKQPVIGIDEVGRGTLAGPVVSCACIYFKHSISFEDKKLINDSKKLSTAKRLRSLKLIMKLKREKKLDFRLGSASVQEIEELNILNATILSMKRAVKKLNLHQGTLIIDGTNQLKFEKFFCQNFIRGDQKSLSIATASIIAKVHRDRYMAFLGREFPYFRWKNNAGYGTAEHLQQLKLKGMSKHHRKNFKPMKNFIQNNKPIC